MHISLKRNSYAKVLTNQSITPNVTEKLQRSYTKKPPTQVVLRALGLDM